MTNETIDYYLTIELATALQMTHHSMLTVLEDRGIPYKLTALGQHLYARADLANANLLPDNK